MKFKQRTAILIFGLLLAGPSNSSIECCDEKIPSQTAPISIEEALADFFEKYPNVTAQRHGQCDKCKSKNFLILDNNTGANFSFRVGDDEFQGNRFLKYALALVKNWGNLSILETSEKALNRDIEKLEIKFGVKMHSLKNKVPFALRFPGGSSQLFSVKMDDENFEIKNLGFLRIGKVSEMIPGKEDYPKNIIYREGDLLSSFFQNEQLFQIAMNQARMNGRSPLDQSGKRASILGNYNQAVMVYKIVPPALPPPAAADDSCLIL